MVSLAFFIDVLNVVVYKSLDTLLKCCNDYTVKKLFEQSVWAIFQFYIALTWFKVAFLRCALRYISLAAMETLDCDKGLLSSGNMVAARDIVQFVELRKFVRPGQVWDKEMLAKQVLAEIPNQVPVL
jgi:Copine